ncbi:MAG: hypothetical protein AABY27_05000 [Pseudomonadota bacterium]
MLRRRDDYLELNALKLQVQELSEEVNSLKAMIKTDSQKLFDENLLGKSINRAVFKNTQNNYNQQLLNQVSKIFKLSLSNIPRSFGD